MELSIPFTVKGIERGNSIASGFRTTINNTDLPNNTILMGLKNAELYKPRQIAIRYK